MKTLWQYLLNWLRRDIPTEETYTLEKNLQADLVQVAARAQLSPDALLDEALAYGLQQYRAAQEYLHYWKMLTDREKQVAAWIIRGYTTRQVAAQLQISTETVKSHATNILEKFNLTRREDLRLILRDWDLTPWL